MSDSDARIVVEVEGLRSSKGQVMAALYAGPDGFPDRSEAAVSTVKAPVQDGACRLVFPNASPGSFAVAAFHDENADGKMNTNIIGIPKEGFGLTGLEKLKLARPDFEAARFTYTGGEQTVRLVMHYL